MRAIVFDVDGTLVGSVDAHARAWQDTFRRFGYDFAYSDLRHNVGKGADQYLAAFLSEAEITRLGDQMVGWRLAWFRSEYLPGGKAFSCVRELFEQLRHKGLSIALASLAKGEELDSYLKLINVEDLLDARTTSDDAEKSRPHPDIFEAALDKLDVTPNEAVVVGDTPYDAEAATRAGIASIGVLCGGFNEQELRTAGFREIYRDSEDLLTRWRKS